MGETKKIPSTEKINACKSASENRCPKFSLVERIINKGPMRNAGSKIGSRIINIAFYSSLIPAISLIYYYLTSTSPFQFPEGSRTLPIEAIGLWTFVVLFVYTLIVYHASGRLRQFTIKIKRCLDYDDATFSRFEEETLEKTFRPPLTFLLLLILTIPILLIGFISTSIYAGDIFTILFLGLGLSYSTFLHWNAIWMLYSFLSTSSRFGRVVPIRINSFDPDKVGGLSPLSDLSTLAIFDVGVLSILIIPFWQMLVPMASYVMISLTSILIPLYFFVSMRGIYNRLSQEKEDLLRELNDEIQKISTKIRGSICGNNCAYQKDEEDITKLGDKLNSLDIIYSRIQGMHTFPVNGEVIVKIFVSAILPILAVIIDVLLTRFL
jgi:hypothetical protein